MRKDYRNVSKGIVSVLIVVIIVSGLLSLLASLKKLSIFDGFRDSLEEYFPGGPSPGEEGDHGEGSSDGSGDGSADDNGDSEDSEESRCDHRDKNDNGICDKCGAEFSDGDEPSTEPEGPEEPECEHVDANDDNVCDKCGAEFSDGDEPSTEPEGPECEHVDANDDNACDKCGAEFSDGDEPSTEPEEPEEPECEHVDANDDNVCDKCEEAFSDGVETCNHVDADGDDKCDKCNKDYFDPLYGTLGSSMNFRGSPSYTGELTLPNSEVCSGAIYDIDIDVLSHFGVYYGDGIDVTVIDGDNFKLAPLSIHDGKIAKLRIEMNEGFESWVSGISTVPGNYLDYKMNAEEGWVEFYFDNSSTDVSDIMVYCDGSMLTKTHIKAIQVTTLN